MSALASVSTNELDRPSRADLVVKACRRWGAEAETVPVPQTSFRPSDY